MRKWLPDSGVVLDDRSSALCCLGVWGPSARRLVESVSEPRFDPEGARLRELAG